MYFFVTNLSFQTYLVTIMPDAMYIVCMMWLFYLILRIVHFKEIDIRLIIELIVSIVLIGLLRQNGIVISVGIAIVLAVLFAKQNKTILLVPMISMAVILLVKGPVYDRMGVERTPHMKYLALMNDIFNSYYAGQDLDDDVEKLVLDVTMGNPDGYKYTQFKAAYNADGYDIDALRKYSLSDFLSLYIRNFFQNPKSVITAILCRTEQIWSVTNAKGSFTVRQQPLNERGDTEEKIEVVGIPERKSNVLTEIYEAWYELLNDTNYISYKFYWRGNFIYNIIICCVITLMIFGINKNGDVFILCLPAALSVFSLMVGGGWPDYRYHVPFLTNAIIMLIYNGYRMNMLEESMVKWN